MTGRVACLGECMMELVSRPDGTLTRGFGGDTLNTAVYLARLGVPTDYVTALGDDTFSDEMLAAWKAEGIGTRGVLRLPGRLPGLYLIQTDTEGERRFFYWRDNAPVRQLFALPETGAIETMLCEAETIYLSGITLSLFGDAGRERLFALLAAPRRQGCGSCSTATSGRAAGRIWSTRAASTRASSRAATSVLASVEDDRLLHGREDADALHRPAARSRRPRERRQARSSRLSRRRRAGGGLIAAEPVSDVVDTTAAGDSFAAAYIAARRAGLGPAASARAGHRLAGAVVRHRGAIIPRAAMPIMSLTPEAAP